MNETMTNSTERPSLIRSFAKGALSSAVSGAMMAGIVALVSALPFLGGAAILTTLAATAPLMILATGLFGGAMAIKRTMFDAPRSATGSETMIPVPVPGMASPAISTPVISADMAPEYDQPSKNWAAATGRDGDAQSRIQHILSQGSMSDKDRASAILAAREMPTSTDVTR